MPDFVAQACIIVHLINFLKKIDDFVVALISSMLAT